MDAAPPDMIVPSQYPQLAGIVWNGDPSRPIAGKEAFALYERYWRFVDRDSLTPAERTLIRRLTEEYGAGRFLG